MAEQAEIFSHHSPYRHRVRATILLDAGLLTSARTIVVVAHFRLARKMMAKNRRFMDTLAEQGARLAPTQALAHALYYVSQ